MRIWALNLMYAGLNMPIRLMFKGEESAKAALAHPLGMDGTFTLHDDFGTEIHTQTPPLARVLSDVVEELEANIEMTLLQHRAQMKAQKRVSSDPTLSNASGLVTPGNGTVLPFGPGSGGGVR